MVTLDKPAHVHDCTGCTFLGTIDAPADREMYPTGKIDLYVCGPYPGERRASVIARRSDDGPDYYSASAREDLTPYNPMAAAMIEARDRAKARGIIH
jgi:hypothetical protein